MKILKLQSKEAIIELFLNAEDLLFVSIEPLDDPGIGMCVALDKADAKAMYEEIGRIINEMD